MARRPSWSTSASATCPRRWSISSRCSAGRPGGDREVLSRDELKALFTLEGISGGNAVFNAEKLDWFNQQHIAPAGRPANCWQRIEGRLREAGLWRDTLDQRRIRVDCQRSGPAETARQEPRSARRRAPSVPRRSARDRSGGGSEASVAARSGRCSRSSRGAFAKLEPSKPALRNRRCAAPPNTPASRPPRSSTPRASRSPDAPSARGSSSCWRCWAGSA